MFCSSRKDQRLIDARPLYDWQYGRFTHLKIIIAAACPLRLAWCKGGHLDGGHGLDP